MNTNIIILPLIYESQSEILTECLKLMKNASFDVDKWRPENRMKLQNISKLVKFFYYSGRYVRKAMFNDGEDQLCALGLSAAIKNHKDTF